MELERDGQVRIGLFEGIGHCGACDLPSRERFELPTQGQVGERNHAIWPCSCGAAIEGSARCLEISFG